MVTSDFFRKFKAILKADDYPVAHHLVHDVRILPGVYLIDLIYRAYLSLGVSPQQLLLKKCTFLEPISMGLDSNPVAHDRIIYVEIQGVDLNRASITISSETTDTSSLDTRTHLRAQVIQGSKEVLTAPTLPNKNPQDESASRVYEFARQVDIQHKTFMQPEGTLSYSAEGTTAKATLSSLAQQANDDFIIHPVFLDFATLVPFSKNQERYKNAYIPIYIENFRIISAPVNTCYVYHKESRYHEPTSDIIYHDLYLYTDNGDPAVIFQRFGAKQIRHENLIQNLTASMPSRHNKNIKKDKINTVEPVIKETNKASNQSGVIALLEEVFAQVMESGSQAICADTVFYELGLDSSDLLTLVTALEKRCDIELYPTLLFEYATLNLLAGYLVEHVPHVCDSVVASDVVADTSEVQGPQVTVDGGLGISAVTHSGDEAPLFERGTQNKTAKDKGVLDEPIAIVGLAGRYPQSNNLYEFWQNLFNGKDCVEEIPVSRWQSDAYYDVAGNQGKSISKWGSFVRGVREFDPLFFGISPLVAEQMDPQERLFLQVAWQAFEDAGMGPGSPNQQTKTGVFCGAMWNEYQLFGHEQQLKNNSVLASSWFSSLANRVSYCFNLKGPSLSLDTACSSALYAIHLACDSLRRGECETALAGAVNLSLHPSKYIRLSTLKMLSPTGRCRAFGDQADGYVPGEGVGAVMLKPLARAELDGNPIYAIIQGSAVTHGGKTGGFSVPSSGAQSEALISALDQANMTPADLDYLEAHGTGTSLGDPIEVEGIDKTYRYYGLKPSEHTLPTGSLKSNLGHLEAAAGIASVSKVLLAMHYQVLPASLHSQVLNPLIDFSASAVKPMQQRQRWLDAENGQTRKAAIASFGAGGSNSYLILESYRATIKSKHVQVSSMGQGTGHWIPLSARSAHQLIALLRSVDDYIHNQSAEPPLALLAHSLQQGRKTHAHRWLAKVTHMADLRACLQASTEPGAHKHSVTLEIQRTLPEVGSAHYCDGSDKSLITDRPADSGQDAAASHWFFNGESWPAQYPQGTAMLPLLPSYPFERTPYWISIPATGAASPNTLLNMPFNTLQRSSMLNAWAAEHNVQSEPTVPGMASLEWMLRKIFSAGGNTSIYLRNLTWFRPLTSDLLQHAELTDTCQDNLLILKHQEVSVCSVEIVKDSAAEESIRGRMSAIDTATFDRAEVKRKELRRLSDKEFYLALSEQGIEYGDALRVVAEISYAEHFALAQLQPVTTLTQLLDGALQCSSVMIENDCCDGFKLPFQVKSVWLDGRCLEARQVLLLREARDNFTLLLQDVDNQVVAYLEGFVLKQVKPSNTSSHEEKSNGQATKTLHAYQPQWQPVSMDVARLNRPSSGLTVVIADRSSHKNWQQLRSALSQQDHCIFVVPGNRFAFHRDLIHLKLGDHKQVGQLLETLAGIGRESKTHVAQVICTSLPHDSEVEFLLALLCQWHNLKQKEHSHWVYLHSVATGDAGNGVQAQAIAALAKTVVLEMPKVQLKSVEVPVDSNWATKLRLAQQELQQPSGCYVCYRDNQRYEQRWSPVHFNGVPSDAILRQGGSYLITGGLGGLGQIFTRFLLQQYAAKVTLVGRSILSGQREDQLAQLNQATSGHVHYIAADISDGAQLRSVLNDVQESDGQFHGVIHCAGVIFDALLPFKKMDQIQQVIKPKIHAVQTLKEQLRGHLLDFVLLCSSVSATMGSKGQADYASANGFMDGFARQYSTDEQPWISVNWPLWREGGMQIGEKSESILADAGLNLLDTEQGLNAFQTALSMAQPNIMLVTGNKSALEKRLRQVERAELTLSEPFNNKMMDPLPKGVARTSLNTGMQSSAVTPSAPSSMVAITDRLSRLLANHLKLQISDIVYDETFDNYGIDSIQTMDFIESIDQQFNMSVSVSEFSELNSIILLAEYIQSQMIGASEKHDDAIPTALFISSSPDSASDITASDKPSEERRIAIVAAAGCFPGAANLEALWQVLLGEQQVNPITYHSLCKRRGYPILESLEDQYVYALDESLFTGLASIGGPLSHQIWVYLSDRMINTDAHPGVSPDPSTAVYLGVNSAEPAAVAAHSLDAMLASSAASVLSRRYGFQGPAMVLDTACSSSLAAIHQGCRDILQGEVKAALCGGLTLLSNPHAMLAMRNKGMLTEDSVTRLFDERASGFGLSEGAGLVMLKSEAQARADGDPILGFILATSIVNEGAHTNTALPNAQALRQLIQRAQQNSGVATANVGYVDVSCVGDQLIDVLELEALKHVYEMDQAFHHCVVGSSKACYGSLLHASGMLALFKSMLAQHHQCIPAQPHVENIGKRFPLDDAHLTITCKAREWPITAGYPRVAVVNNMGMGGTHLHLVLGEGTDSLPKPDAGVLPAPVSSFAQEQQLSPEKGFQQWTHYLQDWMEATIAHRPEVETPFDLLGLESVHLVQLMESIESRVGTSISPSVFFDNPTIAHLARHYASLYGDLGIDAIDVDRTGIADGKNPSRMANPASPMSAGAREVSLASSATPWVPPQEVVAITGMAVKLPGANNLEEFWRLIYEGDCAVAPVNRALGNSSADDKCWHAGLLDQYATFDAAFFGISPREAESMDPQFRMALEVAYHAAEDAGIAAHLRGSETGVFAGIAFRDYEHLISSAKDQHRDSDAHISTGNAATMLANRVSHVFDLKGPSVVVDTACSASLVAVHQACHAIRMGDCKQAIVLGTNLLLSHQHFAHMDALGALSSSGQCYVFDERADGYAPGEAIVAIVLQPASETLARGYRRYANILGGAINHAGRTNSITVPSARRQSELLIKAWRNAGIHSSDLGYIETHGTATPLGDPIEVDALVSAMQQSQGARDRVGQACVLGSVKANLGHSEAAAGLVGLIKTALVLYTGWKPPQTHFTTLNKKIALSKTLCIESKGRVWAQEPEHRYAGVSAFGFGGTNVHLVLGGHKKAQPNNDDSYRCWVPLSAKKPAVLIRQVQCLLRYLALRNGDTTDQTRYDIIDSINLGHIAATLQRKVSMPNRVVFACQDVVQLIQEMQGFVDRASPSGIVYGDVRGADSQGISHVAARWVTGDISEWPSSELAQVYVPGYEFEAVRHWLFDPEDGALAACEGVIDTDENPSLSEKNKLALYRWQWRKEALPVASHPVHTSQLFVSDAILPLLRIKSARTLDYFDEGAVRAAEGLVTLVYVSSEMDKQALENGHLPPLFSLLKKALTLCPITPIKLLFIANSDITIAEDHMMTGLAYATNSIHPHFTMRCFIGGMSEQQINAEISSDERRVVVNYRAGERGYFERQYAREETALTQEAKTPFGFKQQGIYLITGGMGEVGLLVGRYLAQQFQAKLVICGRRALSSPDAQNYQSRLALLNSMGAQAIYIQADCADDNAINKASLYANQRFGPLDGILHLAGHAQEKPLVETKPADLSSIYHTKVSGLRHLAKVAAAQSTKPWLLAFSSTSTLLASSQMVDYSMANACMDRECTLLREKGLPVVSLQLPYWESGGLKMSPQRQALLLEQTGFVPLSDAAGIEALQLLARISNFENMFVTYGKEEAISSTLDKALFCKPLGVEKGIVGKSDKRSEGRSLPLPDSPISAHQVMVLLVEVLRLKTIPSVDTPLIDLGFESITVLEFVQRAASEFGLSLSGADIYSFVSVGEFIEHILQLNGVKKNGAMAIQSVSSKQESDNKILPIKSSVTLIVGLAGRFPGADNLNEFWRNQLAGIDAISATMPERLVGKNLNRSIGGGFLSDVSRFDAAFFDMTIGQAARTDPQQRLLLEACWHALEDAGVAPSSLYGAKVGVFVGISNVEYKAVLSVAAAQHDDDGQSSGHDVAGMSLSMAANRLSYLFNWTGPSEAVDTGCSSSLVALDHARRAIDAGECDWAVVAGVNVLLNADSFEACSKAGMLSPDFRCKTFSENANGYVRGEGVGVILLKGPRVCDYPTASPYAQLLATGVNHGGKGHNLTAPSAVAQARLLHAIYAQPHISIDQLDYIECHGTGTELGDPIEINGIKQAFSGIGQSPLRCGLGTVKTHIGHLESAAGIAGLIRTALSLKNQRRPGNLHFSQLNKHIQLHDTPFYIQENNADWVADGKTRLAGVSSFGFGGVNGHAVLASCPEECIRVPKADRSSLLRWSAKTPAALHRVLESFALWLEEHMDTSVYALEMTLRHHREAHSVRAVMEVNDLHAVAIQLARWRQGETNSLLFAADALDGAQLKERCGHWQRAQEAIDWMKATESLAPLKGIMDYNVIRLPLYPFADTQCWPDLEPRRVRKATSDQGLIQEEAAPVPTEMLRESSPASVKQRPHTLSYAAIRLEVMALFSAVTKQPVDENTADAYFDDMALDSITNLALVNKISQRFGKVSKTLLFEYKTIAELCAYFQKMGVETLTKVDALESRSQQDSQLPPTSIDHLSTQGMVANLNRESGDQKFADGIDEEFSRDNRVAIIGLSGQFPQSANVEEFWQLLVNEQCAISEIPKERFDWRKIFGDPAIERGKSNSKWAGFTPNVSQFAAEFFGISPLEAKAIDPQQRLFLSHCFLALEHAGYPLQQLKGSQTGVFVGVSVTDYAHVANKAGQSRTMHTAVGMSHAMVANRISHCFDFCGPSEAIDTGCSSSLAALHRAVSALQMGDCRMALAGGVNLLLDEQLFVAFGQSGFLSPSGRCHSFSDKADGYVRGEGVGVVVLKRLAEAQRDGDCILSIIESSGVNHGGKVRSVTVPNPNAQSDLIVQTWRKAGIKPSDIDYVEAHGTGTKLGDPIEIQGLKSACEQWVDGAQAGSIRVGSVKANIGHLESGAGIAGLIKLVLCLQHQWLPGLAEFGNANPLLEMNESPLSLLSAGTPWRPQAQRPRRAALSSFGFGGANGHVVIRDYWDAMNNTVDEDPPSRFLFLPLSTHSSVLLAAYIERLDMYFSALPMAQVPPLSRIAYHLQLHDSREHRVLFRCATATQFIAQLAAYLRNPEACSDLFSENGGWINANQAQCSDLDSDVNAWLMGNVDRWPDEHAVKSIKTKAALPPRPLPNAEYWFDVSEPFEFDNKSGASNNEEISFANSVESRWRDTLGKLSRGELDLCESMQELDI